uniref:Uncharacterized protein n=1 Tax=Romanomermis culicivorax TaxID=13658 RepID=A0A915L389_ROMCU
MRAFDRKKTKEVLLQAEAKISNFCSFNDPQPKFLATYDTTHRRTRLAFPDLGIGDGDGEENPGNPGTSSGNGNPIRSLQSAKNGMHVKRLTVVVDCIRSTIHRLTDNGSNSASFSLTTILCVPGSILVILNKPLASVIISVGRLSNWTFDP